MKAFLKDAADRWQQDTPKFFRKIIIGGVGVGGLGTTLAGAAKVGIQLPHLLSDHTGHMMAAGFVAAAVAKFAKIDIMQDTSLPK